MHYQIWQRCLIALSVFMTVIGNARDVSGRPARVFTPQLAQIQNNLPLGFLMRLPSEIRLSGISGIEESKLFVGVFSADIPPMYTVSLSTCDRGPIPCLVGSFSAARNTSASAVREFQRHKARQESVTLSQGILGYLLEGPQQRPAYHFSSVMWEQDGMLYTVTFPAAQRQNILFMAHSMAHDFPLRRVASSPPISPLNRSNSLF